MLLARLRFDRGMTQAEVAAETGLSRATVIRAEAGADLTAPTAKALAGLYGMTASELALAVRAETANTASEPTEREAA